MILQNYLCNQIGYIYCFCRFALGIPTGAYSSIIDLFIGRSKPIFIKLGLRGNSVTAVLGKSGIAGGPRSKNGIFGSGIDSKIGFIDIGYLKIQ